MHKSSELHAMAVDHFDQPSLQTRTRVLISAYACSPFRGSEPGVGWGFIIRLAQIYDVTVIVEENEFKADILSFVHSFESSDVTGRVPSFIFIPRTRFPLMERLWPPSYYWTYAAWQRKALKEIKRRYADGHFDIVHHLNMIGYREPGYLFALNSRFILGPVGGFGSVPIPFLARMSLYDKCFYFAYNLINCVHPHKWRVKRAISSASIILAANRDNQSKIAKYYGRSSKVCIPVGPPTSLEGSFRARDSQEPLRIIWVGLFVGRKLPVLALEVLKRVGRRVNWTLTMIGDGPLREYISQEATRLGLIDRVFFTGGLERKQVIMEFESSHVHLMTSVREGTPTVIAEATHSGIPTICLDLPGMRDMVGADNPLLCTASSWSGAIDEMEKAVLKIFEFDSFRQEAFIKCRSASQTYQWGAKIDSVIDSYEDALSTGK